MKPSSKVEYGITEMPPRARKPGPVPELRNPNVVRNIEVLGPRLAWSRACFCPCANTSDETVQPDPTCVKCQGRGFFYFGPSNYVAPTWAGDLDEVQQAVLSDDGSAIIRGLITRGSNDQNPYDSVGNWVQGEMFLTVRPENRIGYYDRLVNLDAEIVYYEVVEVGSDGSVPLRYRVRDVNNIESVADRWLQGVDFDVGVGGIVWRGTPPSAGTRVAVHYTTHPTWLVWSHPHVVRQTNQRLKVRNPTTPVGEPTALAVQALIRLEFISKREAKFV